MLGRQSLGLYAIILAAACALYGLHLCCLPICSVIDGASDRAIADLMRRS